MNYSFRWRNFRLFKDTGWVDIKPLTILIGPNDSGKSNIIAPLLLMKQTLESRDSNSSLIRKGKYINVGDFRDMTKDHLAKSIDFFVRFISDSEKNNY